MFTRTKIKKKQRRNAKRIYASSLIKRPQILIDERNITIKKFYREFKNKYLRIIVTI